MKMGLLVVGVAVVGYLAYSYFFKAPSVVPVSLPVTTLTDAEKRDLFLAARGYIGGAAPPPQVLEQASAAAAAAQARITSLGLQGEYNAYLVSLEGQPLVP